MKWFFIGIGMIVFIVVILFGYPLFCLLKRFWGWRKFRAEPY